MWLVCYSAGGTGTQHDVDWQSYEGVVTSWLLAYGSGTPWLDQLRCRLGLGEV